MSQALAESEALGRVDLARKCLAMIRDVAERGARCTDPEQVGYALQELTQILLERTGSEDIVFEPVAANRIDGPEALLEELTWVDSGSSDICRGNG
jgi:hypothetical protein